MITPITTQRGNKKALVPKLKSEYIISPPQKKIPKSGNKGTKGTLKGLFLFGSFFLKIKTAIQTTVNEANILKAFRQKTVSAHCV